VSIATALRSLASTFARPRSLDRDGWRVTVDRGGRAGWLSYEEPCGTLRFGWEMLSRGTGVHLPPAGEWDDECARRGAAWAAGRRDEISRRITDELVRLREPGARVVPAIDGFDLLS